MISAKKIVYILLFIFLLNVAFGYISYSIYQDKIGRLESQIVSMKEVMIKTDEVKAQYYYPSVGINKHLQFHTFLACRKYNVDYKLALSVMFAESGFDKDAVRENDNGTKDYGLMQINTVNLDKFYDMGYEDVMNPYANIEFGVYILSQRKKQFNNTHHVVSSYRWGVNGFKSLNVDKTDYSMKIVKYKNNL